MTYQVERIDLLPKLVPNSTTEAPRWRGQLNNGNETIICFFTPERVNHPNCNMDSISAGSKIQLVKYFKKTMKGTDVLIVQEFTPITGSGIVNNSAQNIPNLAHLAANLTPAPSGFPTSVPATAPSSVGHMASGVVPPGRVLPINALNPYNSTWTIKVRVTAKNDIKSWTNARGTGKLFSVDLVDSDGGEIRAVGFNEFCDKWEPILKQGQVYYISNGNLRGAKKQFSTIKNDYQIVFSDKTKIQIDPTGASSTEIPPLTTDFPESIATLLNFTPNAQTNIIGVVHRVGATETLVSKRSGDELTKREIVLVDESGKSVSLTLWNTTAETFSESEIGSIYAFKGCKVSDFGGKSLSMSMGSSMTKNPDIERAHRLRTWYDQTGNSYAFQSLSSAAPTSNISKKYYTISEIIEATPEGNVLEKPMYFDVPFSFVTSIRNNNAPWYTSAPEGSGTKAKVTQQMDGKWHCAANGQFYDNCTYRYVLQFSLDDHTGSLPCNAFDEEASKVMGISADELHRLQEESQAIYEAQFSVATHNPKVVTIQARTDNYQGNTRTRYNTFKVSEVDPVTYSKYLISQIKTLEL